MVTETILTQRSSMLQPGPANPNSFKRHMLEDGTAVPVGRPAAVAGERTALTRAETYRPGQHADGPP